MALRILFIGEIVGKAGIFCVKSLLPGLKKELNPDFVIANGDGVTGGFGLGKNHSIYLHKLGVDVITSGEQIYYKKDMVEHIDRAHYVLRPANFPASNPGRGWRYYSVRLPEGETVAAEPKAEPVVAAQSGEPGTEQQQDSLTDSQRARRERRQLPGSRTIAVVNFLGQSGFNRTHLSNPFTYLPELVSRLRQETNTIIVDFHAVTTAEKSSMFHHADGRVSAVIGTGTRAVTSDATVLPGGTAVISDAGRTGSLNSVAGLDPSIEIKKFLSQVPERSRDALDGLELQGVLVEIDESGRATTIETLRRPCTDAPEREREGNGHRN